MAKINIVHVIFVMRIGGAENMLADLVNEQVKSANVSVIIVNKKIDQVLVDRLSSNVNVYYAERNEKSKNPFVLLKIWFWLLQLKPDVIHCHQHNLINYLPFWRKKMVVTIHTVGVQVKNLRKYKKVFAISDAVKNDLLKRGQIKSTVIYNGIETPSIKPKESDKLNSTSTFKIVQVSRLKHEIKGQHLAIEAINTLRNIHHQDVQLYLIGTGPSLQYLKALTQRYNLESSVFFLGGKDRKWIYENLNEFDLLLQPSIYEGFGLTIVEGLAARLPVVASNVDGPAEILKDIPAGFLFDIHKEGDLVTCILNVMKLTKSNSFQESCDQSRILVCQRYGINQTVSKYLSSYPLLASQLAVA